MKDSKWNKGIETKPIYAILEAVLKAPIDFSDKEKMTRNILKQVLSISLEIEDFLKNTLLKPYHQTHSGY